MSILENALMNALDKIIPKSSKKMELNYAYASGCGCTGNCGQSCSGGCETNCTGSCGRSCSGNGS